MEMDNLIGTGIVLGVAGATMKAMKPKKKKKRCTKRRKKK